ncbi:hypothetical protein HPG69_012278 [Diceros bicornis minor]|uniref:Cytosolic carboxypeptidase 6 n=1 Tax=Diceros bicornis minor TaxID=77932 RepID=A0A7J7F5Q5_DICBM|nr:hypothetical protein HPG69_012278 [Diceros bicornis minor]
MLLEFVSVVFGIPSKVLNMCNEEEKELRPQIQTLFSSSKAQRKRQTIEENKIAKMTFIGLLLNHCKTSLEFYIDIHAHSTMMNGFMYGNIFEDEERFQRQAIFPKLLCQNAEDFSYSSTSFNRDAVKAGTGRRFLGGLLDHTSYCYTLEVSFYSYIVGGTTAAVPYTEEACILGRSPPSHGLARIQPRVSRSGRIYLAGGEGGLQLR